ncbi:hypothetical protein WS88_31025 [Burkholderia cepacia]|nr:hypothetical protein WS88_31025 [Burkholderia cepacia]
MLNLHLRMSSVEHVPPHLRKTTSRYQNTLWQNSFTQRRHTKLSIRETATEAWVILSLDFEPFREFVRFDQPLNPVIDRVFIFNFC